MSRRYVNQLGHQDVVDQVFVVAEKQLRPNRNGNLYLQMELSDRTGKIGARMWNASEAIYKSFENGDYVRVEGTTQLFQGAVQLIATRLTKVSRNEVNADDFAPLRAVEVDKLVLRLGEILRNLTNPALQTLAECFLLDETFMAKFTRAPAGVKNHHAYLGGLLEHVVNLMEVVLRVSPCYPEVDPNLLLMGAFLHDMGKVDELRYEREPDLQRRGATDWPPGDGHRPAGSQDRRGGEALRRADPRRDRAAAEAHDCQPSRRVRLRQPEAAHDPGGRGPVLPRQSRRQGQRFPAALRDDPNVDSPWTAFYANLDRKLFKGKKE